MKIKDGSLVSTFQEMLVRKAYVQDGVLYREGWLSTNARDRKSDITEPEAFAPVLNSYFAACAPVTSTHDTKSYPIGHLQRGALVRDGKIFQEAVHPTDPAEFSNPPDNLSGFYGRFAINDPIATHQVVKGNVGGCSFIASANKYEPLQGGGYRYLEFEDLMETTIAAFPINPQAVHRVAKAYGYDPDEEKEPTEMTPEQIQAMIDAAIAASKAPAETPTVPVIKAEVIAPAVLTPEMLTAALSTMSTTILTAVDTKLMEVKKAAVDYSREGTGRVGVIVGQTGTEADTDPVAYIVKKAESGEEFTQADKDLAAELTLTVLRSGMQDQ